MGLLTRTFVPRSVRRATHPVRTVKRASTPRVVKQAQRSLHPVSNAVYSAQRPLNTKRSAVQVAPDWLSVVVVAALSLGIGYTIGWGAFWIALIVLSTIAALIRR